MNCFFTIDTSVPSTPVKDLGKPSFEDSQLDAMERALRERQRECEERKRKILEQYQQVSKQPAGKLKCCIFPKISNNLLGPKLWV